MKSAIILGDNSHIAKGIKPLMEFDHWTVTGWNREKYNLRELPHWDLAIITVGQVWPVGLWFDLINVDWEECFEANLFLPMRLLRAIWSERHTGASVCWFAGSNPQMIMDGYSAYNVSKMAVLKAVEQLDHESTDCKFFALGPGIVLSKIHEASKDWVNPKLEAAQKEGRSTPMQDIWDCMKWCIQQPKTVIGGRNICVSDPWGSKSIVTELKGNTSMYKLRRIEF